MATIDLNQASRWHSAGMRDALAVLATPRRIRFDELLGLVQRDVSPDELGVEAASIEPMLVLSYVLLNFPAEPADGAHGMALLDYVRRHFGTRPIDRLPPLKRLRVSGAALNAYWDQGDLARFAELVESLTKDGLNTENTSRGLNVRHPALRPEGADAWLERFNATFFPAPGWQLDFRDRRAPRLDEIVMGAFPDDPDDTLVSVILTSFNTGPPLTTAVRSVLHQTHRNLELVVVDDRSSDQSHLDEVEGLDPRVRVIRLPENLGTYNARNVGIDATSGPLITFQDSDDWSHPMRLETQVRILREDPKLLQVLGYSVFASDELYLRDPFEPIQIAGSTAMFRREQVAEVGYYDRVRRSADSEHIARLATAGPDTALHLKDVPIGIQRKGHESLTRGEIHNGWVHPARAFYRQSWLSWHAACVAGGVRPSIPDPGVRHFVVPHRNLAERRPFPDVDVVVLIDCVNPSAEQVAIAERIIRHVVGGDSHVAIVNSYPAKLGEVWHPELHALLDDDQVHLGFLDDPIGATVAVVLTACDLQVPPAVQCRVSVERVLVRVEPGLTPAADEGWVRMVTRPRAERLPDDPVSADAVSDVIEALWGRRPLLFADDVQLDEVTSALGSAYTVIPASEVLTGLV